MGLFRIFRIRRSWGPDPFEKGVRPPLKSLLMSECPHHSIHLIVDMLSGDLCRLVFVSGCDGIYDCLMFFKQLRIAFFFLQILYTVAVHLLSKIIQQLDEPPIIRSRENDVVKGHVGFRNLSNVITAKHVTKVCGRGTQVLKPLLVDPVA